MLSVHVQNSFQEDSVTLKKETHIYTQLVCVCVLTQMTSSSNYSHKDILLGDISLSGGDE